MKRITTDELEAEDWRSSSDSGTSVGIKPGTGGEETQGEAEDGEGAERANEGKGGRKREEWRRRKEEMKDDEGK